MDAAKLLCLFVAALISATGRADLAGYVNRPEPAFAWTLSSNDTRPQGTVFTLHLVSQVWQGVSWQHELRFYVPRRNETPQTVLLFVSGGSPHAADDEFGLQMAVAARAPCAILYGIPNQPLLGDKYEDDLIAETFLRFLKTADPDWPLLLPMTKSVVRAMDALQSFASSHLARPVQNFVITGASKRGWTSWLTAAVDQRVAGVAPRVFDMVNIAAQLPHQLESWGTYSEMLRPYVQPGLPNFLGTHNGRQLIDIVDPFSYRDRLQVPKLMILGTNDRYWTLDAPNLFWRDLPGSSAIQYVPNAGHGLGNRENWIGTLICFFRAVAAKRELPRLEWTVERSGEELHWMLDVSQHPRDVQLWFATSRTLDFREAHWESIPVSVDMRPPQGHLSMSKDSFTAAFMQATYDIDGDICTLTTLVHIEPSVAGN